MEYAKSLSKEETIEQGIERLKETAKMRDAMGGALYWNILNDDVCELARQLLNRGANRETLADIVGRQNFR